MNTQSHLIINSFAANKLYRNLDKTEELSVIGGALIPDSAMFVFFVYYSFIVGAPQDVMWKELFFQPSWQAVFSVGNSIPLFFLLLLVSIFLKNRAFILLSFSVLLHIAGDFFVHADDAHSHFFPLSDFRFESPISYWDPNFHGQWVSIVEIVLVLICSYFIFRRFKSTPVRVLIVIGNMLNIFSYIFLFFIFKGEM
jgi:hypothetical protein